MSFLGAFFGNAQKKRVGGINTPLDMVTYAAGLVSNPDIIDPVLDPVRSITTSLTPGQTPSSSEMRTLFGVYLKIEAYLATKETIRSFTTEELRSKFAPQLRQQLESYVNNKGS